MRRFPLPAAIVAVVLAVPFVANATSSVKVGALPATVTLPAGWTATGATSTARFNATGPNGGRLAVTTGGSFPSGLPFSLFVSTETTAARNAYRAEDPHASVSSKKVKLPPGDAVQITTVVHHGGVTSAIDLFSLLHNGVTYHFTFFTNGPSLGSSAGSFASIAKSIHFTK
ncbi:MAG TPA: hypothetical protein VH063_06220 [Gaiellaceae bacterium]|jgi:hypothetical protein|nr:hypothetical protein [Gaiellaceae bacterium]